MNLHEYQAKQLMREYQLPLLCGQLCHTPGEAEAAYDNLCSTTPSSTICVVKAQVHAGGRGKAGGVKLVKSSAEARAAAEAILGMCLVSPQTGPQGKIVRKIYVESGCQIAKEFYLSLVVDRSRKALGIVASTEGGMEIEEVAHKHPEKIVRLSIDSRIGFQPFQGLQLGLALGLDVAQSKELSQLVSRCTRLFFERDLSMVEINPLVLTAQGGFVVLDAKCSVDDNALYRQPQLKCLLDYDELDAKDLRAGRFGLSYIALDGDIGCMVNGAGLAMATMDIIKSFGGKPANFLDVGGGASKETVTEAFKILLSDGQVKAILVNIFGGIMKCDVIAAGIVAAAKELSVRVPLVVRLQGTNVELGKEILAKSGLSITPANTMDEAAQKIVSALASTKKV